jgi:hypothetical protein
MATQGVKKTGWKAECAWAIAALVVLSAVVIGQALPAKPNRPKATNANKSAVAVPLKSATKAATNAQAIRNPFAASTRYTPPAAANAPWADPFARAPFIEVSGLVGVRAWSDRTTTVYVKDGKLVAALANSSAEPVAEPPAGTPLYRANGTLAGWIGPDSARPASIHSIPVPLGYTPVAGQNGSKFGDISDVTGRPKTIYVNGYCRSDGTYVRGHWRSAPQPGGSSTYTSTPRIGAEVAENGSYYGQISGATGRPKTTYVGGYYRRDGTYVRGHYRSR